MADAKPSVIFDKGRGAEVPTFSYSGADFDIWAYYPLDEFNGTTTDLSLYTVDKSVIPFGNLQTITTSVAASKTSVDQIGSSMADSYTRGQKTYAGSLIFSVLEREPLQFILDGFANGLDANATQVSLDQLPPFNIVIQGTTEYLTYRENQAPTHLKDALPKTSIFKVIVGVELVQYGETISVDDFFLEQNHQYVATWVSPWIQKEINFAEINRMVREARGHDKTPTVNIPHRLPIDFSDTSLTGIQKKVNKRISALESRRAARLQESTGFVVVNN